MPTRRVAGRTNGLRTAREALGLKLDVAAQRAGMSTAMLSLLERGLAPVSFEMRVRLESLYGASIESLLDAARRK